MAKDFFYNMIKIGNVERAIDWIENGEITEQQVNYNEYGFGCLHMAMNIGDLRLSGLILDDEKYILKDNSLIF